MTALPAKTGRPVVVLVCLLVLWVFGRFLLWQSPFPVELPPLPDSVFERLPLVTAHDPVAVARSAHVAVPSRQPVPASIPSLIAAPAAPFYEPAALASRGEPFDENSVHQLMWLAALSGPAMPSTPFVAGSAAPSQAAPLPVVDPRLPAGANPSGRWSLTGWVFLRQGNAASAALGAGPTPSYGASQAGGVLRYRLAPGSPHRPEAYVRVTSALRIADDRELAAGLAVRPLAGLPVAVMGEGRVRERNGSMIVRPAALAVTELAPQRLPGGLEGELYLQGGYVAAPDATAFGDGQLRVTARLRSPGPGVLRAGVGAWAGAQRGAARVDIGPTAQLDLPIGDGGARLALDYRVRVAGDAAPGSGLALTLSTGF